MLTLLKANVFKTEKNQNQKTVKTTTYSTSYLMKYVLMLAAVAAGEFDQVFPLVRFVRDTAANVFYVLSF